MLHIHEILEERACLLSSVDVQRTYRQCGFEIPYKVAL
jgi:hypothetical protein